MWKTLIRCLSTNRFQISQIMNLWSCSRIASTIKCHSVNHFFQHRECFPFSHGIYVPINVQCIQASRLHHYTLCNCSCMADTETLAATRKSVTVCTLHSPDTHLRGSSMFTSQRTHRTQPVLTKLYRHNHTTVGRQHVQPISVHQCYHSWFLKGLGMTFATHLIIIFPDPAELIIS